MPPPAHEDYAVALMNHALDGGLLREEAGESGNEDEDIDLQFNNQPPLQIAPVPAHVGTVTVRLPLKKGIIRDIDFPADIPREDFFDRVLANMALDRATAQLGWRSNDEPKRGPVHRLAIDDSDDVDGAFRTLLKTKNRPRRQREVFMEIIHLNPAPVQARKKKTSRVHKSSASQPLIPPIHVHINNVPLTKSNINPTAGPATRGLKRSRSPDSAEESTDSDNNKEALSLSDVIDRLHRKFPQLNLPQYVPLFEQEGIVYAETVAEFGKDFYIHLGMTEGAAGRLLSGVKRILELDKRAKKRARAYDKENSQGNHNSPLYSAETFQELGLHPDLLKGLFAMGFDKPSKIQEKALPFLLTDPCRVRTSLLHPSFARTAHRDPGRPTNMIGQSQSGTGKTAAFVFTMLTRIDYDLNKPQAISLARSRELARQIMSVITAVSKYTSVRTVYAIKDSLPHDATNVTAQIIVGTPGTMSDLLRHRRHVEVFLLDEVDNMLDQDGLGEQTLCVKNLLRAKQLQVILFSATLPGHVRSYASKIAPNANKIELQKELSVDNICQFYMDCRNAEHRYDILVSLYRLFTIGQSIIFYQDAAERDAIIDRFREGREKVLIATNVIARGIDIMQVNMAVNYDLPLINERVTGKGADERPDIETYIHRIGRTGRFGRRGVLINFVHDKKTWMQIELIEKALGKKITRIETNDVDEMEAVILLP
ncbi:hypothetical protein HYPSUDRAFT_208729 [Hypholoma sublateritium FD-334 SS-4]|uniref:ATP-dependent RNA helicase n=1 Tax=Hypholoma sublateritium (strain FD-334 SS-4) TaxID=945553 RepID=A0A0D2KIF5_HYPSF|nr:hypothetical protein HYPSUDRAFT_208729 [Hypholoma sublateritium FD-334 SS-4]